MASPPTNLNDVLQSHLNRLLSSRDYPKTICPSEVPRALNSAELDDLGIADWRDLMPAVRKHLWDMRQRGEVEILQKGIPMPETMELQDIKGPIRARRIHG